MGDNHTNFAILYNIHSLDAIKEYFYRGIDNNPIDYKDASTNKIIIERLIKDNQEQGITIKVNSTQIERIALLFAKTATQRAESQYAKDITIKKQEDDIDAEI